MVNVYIMGSSLFIYEMLERSGECFLVVGWIMVDLLQTAMPCVINNDDIYEQHTELRGLN